MKPAACLVAVTAFFVQALPVGAQSLGTFTWQLQPFCNRLTVGVTQSGSVYTLDGFDDQCGSSLRAPTTGIATPNHDGTIGLGLTIVTVPGGRALHVDARITLGTLGGLWTDSAGNSGTFVFDGQAAGVPRPPPPAPGVPTNSVTSVSIVDGSVAAADVNFSEVQLRVVGACAKGQFMTAVSAYGAPACTPWSGSNMQSGSTNTALGLFSLKSFVFENGENTAIGNAALRNLHLGNNNTAIGYGALGNGTSGDQNVAVGVGALQNATGSSNVAVGYQAGNGATTGSNNVFVANAGTSADDGRIRIGTAGTQTSAFVAGVRGVTVPTGIPVIIGTDGQLGTTTSSRRFKQDVYDMGDASAPILRLRPVTFRYAQPAADGSRPLDFGLIAEEVAELFPELAVRGADGQIETVAYHKLPALLLNELQKQQRVIGELQQRLRALESAAGTLSASRR